jgi:hypothetical protein
MISFSSQFAKLKISSDNESEIPYTPSQYDLSSYSTHILI